VVSKPGGMALAESLMTATPLVFLAPFGEHERINALNWISEGLGIWFDDWQARDFAEEAIEPIHANLMAVRENISPYDCD
jgi:UDP-N-acetylglucosamine:LPS N-acetylglucosamine transferase